jgi:hypothetical protein
MDHVGVDPFKDIEDASKCFACEGKSCLHNSYLKSLDSHCRARVSAAEDYLIKNVTNPGHFSRFFRAIAVALPTEIQPEIMVDLFIKLKKPVWGALSFSNAMGMLRSCQMSCFRLVRHVCRKDAQDIRCVGDFGRTPHTSVCNFDADTLPVLFDLVMRHCLPGIQFFDHDLILAKRTELERCCCRDGSRWHTRIGGCFAKMLPKQLLEDKRFVMKALSRVNDDGLSLLECGMDRDKCVVKEFVKWQNCIHVTNFIDDLEVASNAVIHNAYALDSLSMRLRRDSSVLRLCAKTHGGSNNGSSKRDGEK